MYCGKNIYKVIVKLCEERRISVSELADLCGLNRNSIYNIKYSEKVKISKIIKICCALGITVQEFIDDPFFDEIMD